MRWTTDHRSTDVIDARGQSGGATTSAPPRTSSPEEDRDVHFVSFVLDDVRDNWTRIMPALGRPYERARIVEDGAAEVDDEPGRHRCTNSS